MNRTQIQFPINFVDHLPVGDFGYSQEKVLAHFLVVPEE